MPSNGSLPMARMQKQLVNTIENSGVRVLAINLYDLVIDLLKQRGIFEQMLAVEASSSKDEFRELLLGVGERSMLGVFQQVVIQVANQATGRLATFDTRAG